MPIYEFYSPDTHRVYSFFARTLAEGEVIPRCPDGDACRMERRVSAFAVVKNRGDTGPGDVDEGYTADDARLEQALDQIEREYRGVDDADPDPRQIAGIMRRMESLLGRRMPEAMREVIGRLEAGDDPEALEGLFGDDLEGEMADYAQNLGGDSGGGAVRELGALLRRAGREPQRDPTLYEMRDYLPPSGA